MKFVFFGTPEFAAIIMEKLINPPPTKLLTQKYNIPILQPEKLLDIKSQLSDVNCQLFVVAAYSKIIPKEILEIPRLGTIGVHPSLLPKYRGATPIQTAILKGDEKTGTTLFLIDEKVDHGKIVASSKYQAISNDNYESLLKKLAELNANLLIEILPDIEEKIKNALPQDESQATYTKKFKTEDAFIKPEDLKIAQNGSANSPKVAIEIEKKTRALNPEPGVFTFINNKRVKLLEAKIIEGKLKPTKIQKEGKRPQIINNSIESL